METDTAEIIDGLRKFADYSPIDFDENALIGAAIAKLQEQQWIPVSEKGLPVGQWLVQLEDGDRHVAKVRENITITGGHFSFDMPKPVFYCAMPPKVDTKQYGHVK